jgi:hypothetical protein
MAAFRTTREAALDQIPVPYSTALRLRDAGMTDEMIAERISVESEAMEAFMQLAAAKLDHVLR